MWILRGSEVTEMERFSTQFWEVTEKERFSTQRHRNTEEHRVFISWRERGKDLKSKV